MFLAIGVSAARKSRGSKEDYYLASQGIKPWLVGLSAVATNNSGYMFIGAIGYSYVEGLASIWLMIGWILGDFFGSLFVHKQLRRAAAATGEPSYVGVLSHWSGKKYISWQRLAGFISLLFLLSYAAAQLVAGSKALQVLFEWPSWAGAVMGAFMVVAYCFAGGIRASIWTDAAQSIVMIVAMSVMLIVGLQSLGGIGGAVKEMSQIDGFLHWFPEDLIIPGIGGGLLFVIGWFFAGISVIGQPHVMVRFMALDNVGSIRRAKMWYYLWFTLFYSMAVAVGLLSRVYLPDTANFDAELALPTMAVELLPAMLVGLVLAGIFAATMSTADSLLLSCSATLTHDLFPRKVENMALIKGATVVMTFLALVWALINQQSVFSLVVFSWSALASAFGPILILLALNQKISLQQMFMMTLGGLIIMFVWRWLNWHNAVYEGMPGILTGLLLYGITRPWTPAPESVVVSSKV
jgi:SSS family transporter